MPRSSARSPKSNRTPRERELVQAIGECLLVDQGRLRRRLERLRETTPDRGRKLDAIAAAIDASRDVRRARASRTPKLNWPADLPIVEERKRIAEAIEAHQVVVVCGETGSGKSTQLPKICLELGRGVVGRIGHTQPRRIAARSVAARIAEELGEPLGQTVGSTIRFHDTTQADTLVKVMTDGILLAETQGDRRLHEYDTLIIDEAHERSLNIDFLLGYLRKLQPRRPDLKIIVTSATIDPERLSDHFGGAPIIEVSGRTYPVEVRYAPVEGRPPEDPGVVAEAVEQVVGEVGGDVLVFLSGEREIRLAAKRLRQRRPDFDVLPLYARLSVDEQQRVFAPHNGVRIVLATNVAETSLTVPGIRAVVDPGMARISRYSARSRVQRLPVEPVSQASARQRAGRCGRIGPGVCVRLYEERDFTLRDAFTAPEVLRTNLASVILRMTALELGDVRKFPFVEAPTRAMVRDGLVTLEELGAIDASERLTPLGRRLAALPVDPRLGRMILAADDEDAVDEVITIAAALAVADVRERPHDAADRADAAHATFADPASDFLGLLNLWRAYHATKEDQPWSVVKTWCQEHFVSFVRMREWVDVRRQLQQLAREGGLRFSGKPASNDAIHRALLAGLLTNVGRRREGRTFEGVRGGEFLPFPGSALAAKPPKWTMAAEIVETTRRYARTMAQIEPEWIEAVGSHLVQRKYNEPYWDRDAARVMVFERVLFQGLEVIGRRRVPYAPVDAVEARHLFIHHALVEGDWDSGLPFLEENRRLRAQLAADEAKQRRRDLVVDVHRQHAFFDERLPADVYSGKRLENWYRRASKAERRSLRLARADLLAEGAQTPDRALFPATLTIAPDLELEFEYRLEPGAVDDGVTLRVPVTQVTRLDAERLAWGVPGHLEESVTALLRGLPKTVRRELVPVPETGRACAAELTFADGALTEAVAAWVHRRLGVVIPKDAWRTDAIPEALRINLRVLDDEDVVLAEGRDLDDVRRRVAGAVKEALSDLAAAAFDRDGITTWDLEPIPGTVTLAGGVVAYPALEDAGAHVRLRVFAQPAAANAAHRAGVRRLLLLACADELDFQLRHLPGLERMVLNYGPFGDATALRRGIAWLAGAAAFGTDLEHVRDAKAFRAKRDAGWKQIGRAGLEAGAQVADLLDAWHEVHARLRDFDKPVWSAAVEDVLQHVARLVPRDFLARLGPQRMEATPRYLRALVRRLDRLPGGGLERDRALAEQLNTAWQRYEARRAAHRERSIYDPALATIAWMLDEWAVALFAQELGTAFPVSEKRIEQQWAHVLP